MEYRELAPHPALRGIVICYWRLGAGDAAIMNRVLPDGCFDLIFVLAGATVRADGHRMVPGGHVVGPMSRGILIEALPGTALAGVRFRPGALSRRFGGSLARLRDQALPAEAVLGGSLRSWADAIACSRSDRELVAALDRRLLEWRVFPAGPGPLVRALDLLARGRPSSRDLMAATGVSERTLERLFAREIGFGPKAVARLFRFRRALERLAAARHPSLGAIAHEAGYADQAHFTREFAGFAGISPASYRAEGGARASDLSDSFKTERAGAS